MEKKAILIEDNPRIARVLPALLRNDGFEVVTCPSSLPSLSAQEWKAIQVVICDLALPEQDGVELALSLRQRGFTGLIVFITGLPHPVMEPFLHRLSPYLLLQKPFSFAALKAQLCAGGVMEEALG